MKITKKADKIPGLTGRLNLVLKEDFGGVASRLAKSVNISAGALAQYLKGESIPGGEILFKLGQQSGRSIDWLLTGKEESVSSKGVAETDAPYGEIDDLSEEELGYIDMLVEIFKGSNEDNRVAIKSNLKAFHKSRNMPEPRIKTGRRHKQGPGRNSKKIANSNEDK